MRPGSATRRERADAGSWPSCPVPQPSTYSSAQEAGQCERSRRTCQRNGHQLLKATVAGDGVDINDERWRPHVAQCDDRHCEARET